MFFTPSITAQLPRARISQTLTFSPTKKTTKKRIPTVKVEDTGNGVLTGKPHLHDADLPRPHQRRPDRSADRSLRHSQRFQLIPLRHLYPTLSPNAAPKKGPDPRREIETSSQTTRPDASIAAHGRYVPFCERRGRTRAAPS
jgi:hypothetical protein